ncbi:hypothetical protein AB7238_08035 [Providencia alcalifaciens]
MFFKTPENYLELRQHYLKEFFFDKSSILDSISMNKIFIDTYSLRMAGRKRSLMGVFYKDPEGFNEFKISDNEYINIDELKWIKKGRISWMVTNFLFLHYRHIRKVNNYRPMNSLNENYSPVDCFYHEGEEIKYDEIVLLIDILTVFSGKEKIWNILCEIKKKAQELLRRYQEPFKFINGSNELIWLLNRFDKKEIHFEGDVNQLCKNSDKKIAISRFDCWSLLTPEPEVKLFLLETKKAIYQKRFRDKTKDKEVLNTYISKQAKRRLKYLAKKHKVNINEVLEIFILGNDNRTQSEKLIEALESTMK